MINTSNEYKAVVGSANRKFYGTAEITLLDGTVLNLDSTNIVGSKFDDAVSQQGHFTIGAAIINKHTLSINNMYDEYSSYDFTGAIIRPSIGLQLSSTIETLNKGVFTADDPKVRGSVVTLTALDNMAKFDRPFKDVSIVFPTTALILLTAICAHCGVSLATTSFLNSGYTIATRPLDDATNCREVVSWIAQISGNFARCNTSGQLELKWYDFQVFETEANYSGGEFDSSAPYSSGDNINGGNFDDYTSGDNVNGGTFDIYSRFHHIYALNNFTGSTDDVVITGIKVTDNAEAANSVLYGESGYVISIEGNNLIQSQSDAQIVANSVGAKIVGMRFRPCSLTAISDPSREAGDVAYVSDRKGNVYQALLTSVSSGIYQNDNISCDAESPSRNSAVRYSDATKAIIEARKNTEQKLTAYDLLVKQMTDVITHGYGMFKTEVVDGSGATIFYLHDKKTMDESTVRWFTTSEGTIEQTKSGGVWVTVSGTDKQGNALYNYLTARKISADLISTGKITSTSGKTLIDMEKGVANSDNISMTDNVADGYPLRIPFNIDDDTGVISKVILKFAIDKFRAYSDGASSGGGTTTTSESGGGGASTTDPSSSSKDTNSATQYISIYGTSLTTDNGGSINQSTGTANATSPHSHNMSISSHSHSIGSHDHGVLTSGHWHSMDFEHSHGIDFPSHSHGVNIPSHSHGLNFGIMETPVVHNLIAIQVDGVVVTSANAEQGTIDLTAYITTTGWHTIEILSATLKKISAQLNIKSYIQM